MQNIRFSCQSSMKLDVSRQILEKISNVKFHEIRPVWASRSMRTEGRTDRQFDDAGQKIYNITSEIFNLLGKIGIQNFRIVGYTKVLRSSIKCTRCKN